MTWTKITIAFPEGDYEWITAELVDWGVEAFEEDGNEIRVWFDQIEKVGDLTRQLTEWKERGRDLTWSLETVEEQNWNRVWEESIQPQSIGPFFIHPTWSPLQPPEGSIGLAIDPKMAFGTGYHATTHLILQWLPEVVTPQTDWMLDAGTGTGILAIAALKLGVPKAIGFDVDPWSVRNALENRDLNGVGDRLEVLDGDVSVVPESSRFDLIVANINRNVLVGMLPDLLQRLSRGGVLLLSGLLDRDEPVMRDALTESGQSVDDVRHRGEWIAMKIVADHD